MSRKKTEEQAAFDERSVLGLNYEDEDEDEDTDRGDLADDVEDEDEDAEEESEEDPEEESEEEEPAEEEPTEEEPAEEEPEEEEAPTPAPKKDNNPLIPRARLNQEIQRRKDVERQLADALAKVSQPQQATAAPARKEIDKAAVAAALERVLDGDVENATAALVEVLGGLGADAGSTKPVDIAAAVKQELQRSALERTAAELIESNPFLDETNEDMFDADAAEDVLAMQEAAMRRGVEPIKALTQAVQKVSKLYGYGEEAPTPAPAAAKKPAPKLKPADVVSKMKQAEKAPARLPKTAQPANRERVVVAELNDEDFDTLSRDALRRARGDFA